ncbi:MAG: hypothetical protein CL565_02770 [Alphaproteobacteria bacterium]|nr:hypothetical protein [Alphaproteobacteria bacterium]
MHPDFKDVAQIVKCDRLAVREALDEQFQKTSEELAEIVNPQKFISFPTQRLLESINIAEEKAKELVDRLHDIRRAKVYIHEFYMDKERRFEVLELNSSKPMAEEVIRIARDAGLTDKYSAPSMACPGNRR